MDETQVKTIIENTVNATVLKMKMAGLLKDNRKTAYQKTEELLRSYPTFKNIKDQPYTEKIVKRIDEALKEIESDIYYDIIPLSYFDNETRENIAELHNTTVTTISRNKNRLVNVLKKKLFSDDFIFELYL